MGLFSTDETDLEIIDENTIKAIKNQKLSFLKKLKIEIGTIRKELELSESPFSIENIEKKKKLAISKSPFSIENIERGLRNIRQIYEYERRVIDKINFHYKKFNTDLVNLKSQSNLEASVQIAKLINIIDSSKQLFDKWGFTDENYLQPLKKTVDSSIEYIDFCLKNIKNIKIDELCTTLENFFREEENFFKKNIDTEKIKEYGEFVKFVNSSEITNFFIDVLSSEKVSSQNNLIFLLLAVILGIIELNSDIRYISFISDSVSLGLPLSIMNQKFFSFIQKRGIKKLLPKEYSYLFK